MASRTFQVFPFSSFAFAGESNINHNFISGQNDLFVCVSLSLSLFLFIFLLLSVLLTPLSLLFPFYLILSLLFPLSISLSLSLSLSFPFFRIEVLMSSNHAIQVCKEEWLDQIGRKKNFHRYHSNDVIDFSDLIWKLEKKTITYS